MKKNKFQTSIIFVLIPVLVIIGKLVRYTIMKNILVDAGIGHNWISIFNSNMQISEILRLKIAGEQNGTAIIFYKFLNIFNLKTYGQFEVYISVIFNFIICKMFFDFKERITIFQACFLAMSIIILNLFDFCLSKEPIQMLFFLIIYLILISKKIKNKELFSILAIFFSALIFRSYYLLIIAFYFEFKILIKNIFFDKSQLNIRNVLFCLAVISITYIIMLIVCKKLSPDAFNELIRVRNRTSSAFSDIRSIFKNTNNLLLIGFNYLLTIIRILFPIELIKGGLKYILYILYQLMITYILITSLSNFNKLKATEKVSCLLLWAFVFTSATFEPDFGSWIRHEAILFPLFAVSSNLVKTKLITNSK